MSSTDSFTGTLQSITTSPEKTNVFSQVPTEKPFHYTYLKEFRVEQCPLFLQHKCTQHRPFTCFHWHFMNQRRRRPKKKRDGVFNYNPDVYCTQYDETSGMCPSSDDCPYLHRVAGDVERRYHLRYYKTAICVHETDSRGFCVKNGPHCAFAHGPHDIRQPVYDIRELQAMERDETPTELGLQAPDSKVQLDDPRWQDTSYVLAHYKTEQCKKPPRLCRQGYACPHFHNARDCRRSPRKFRYRSTPCPNVKHGDEWGEPTNCENGDNCPYCHTRTEQQFHPEIYKSTKCNDMQQTGYCPRGPFCAFAHVEQEFSVLDENDYGQFSTSLSQSSPGSQIPSHVNVPQAKTSRSLSMSSSYSGETPLAGSYPRAPGSERSESRSSSRDADDLTTIRNKIAAIENDPNLDDSEKARRRQSLLSMRCPLSSSSSAGSVPSTPVTSVSVSAIPFYPAADTVESVVEKALDELHFDDFDVSDLEKELNGSTSLPGADVFTSAYQGLSINPVGCTPPLSIPGAMSEPSPQQSFTPQSPCSPRDQFSPFSSKMGSNPYRNSPTMRSYPSGLLSDPFGPPIPSPKQQPSPQLTSPLALSGSQADIDKLSQELSAAHVKLASWEQAWTKARQACEAWKKEADQAEGRARKAEQERLELSLKLEQTPQIGTEDGDGGAIGERSYLQILNKSSDIEKEPLTVLKQIQQHLRMDSERLDRVIYCREWLHCVVCKVERRCMVTCPCNHCIVCENCSITLIDCPQCHAQISQKIRIDLGL
ncbi:E3 ubiquitin- ligase UNKL isoform X1 [Paramuricea clavata]|uniref:E3 ubiquitin- ligase UNKL isoform X1 n=1 Tax=Paramuricea clavata TaxID=317549 RepID=A0A7D9HUW7_PARCT|nr:E3 ubiquitin- ligase UNKL isoform X1 [Paramuricea clavata]